ncbi:DUF1905 domain-containing protein [Nocardioides bruguierae]|uniref:DUF1905 domain-containing protein n=1 Tax=Nocardioides bruguierae TaxID=2945102 RepID=A0A9X2D976_9ACTN|nr:DUF1905 domain-containing protein [Nocardioides bruguierae]MCL8026137.1 DUF1905 domain-containing protein [Nocardioides bruguierae]MCM0621481.1 DUF1905 domain-containing protein [Nocardioides bruguierae]
MEIPVRGTVIEWRGPAPHHFVPVPEDVLPELREAAAALTYGWGCVPARGVLGATTFTTSLIPRDGGFLVPLKKAVRAAEGVEPGDEVSLVLHLG